MKKALVLFAFVGAVMFSACGGGEPNLDDADAVAAYMCDKTKEMMDLAKDLEGNASKIADLEKDMESFEEKIEKHHKEGEKEFQQKVQEAFKNNCDIKLPGM